SEGWPITASDRRPEGGGQGARQAGRAALSEPDRQYAGGAPPEAMRSKAHAKTTRKTQVTRDPRGGLTAAGRAEFARQTGARLKPGVKKAQSAMTPQEMRRKGSWAVRFYGRAGKLPPLQDAAGKPTRFALTAAAWGEPVPKTVSAARK